MGFGVWGLEGFGVWGLGFGRQGLRLRGLPKACWVFGVWGVSARGFRAPGFKALGSKP